MSIIIRFGSRFDYLITSMGCVDCIEVETCFGVSSNQYLLFSVRSCHLDNMIDTKVCKSEVTYGLSRNR